MAAKVKIEDITDAGFRPEQFGTPADWSQETGGYLSRLIARAEQWAIGRFGAGYAAVPVDSTTHERLRAAELCWVSGHLWKRRAADVVLEFSPCWCKTSTCLSVLVSPVIFCCSFRLPHQYECLSHASRATASDSKPLR